MASAGPVSGIGSLFSRVLSLSESRVSACCAAVAGRCNKLPANVAKVIVVQQRQQQQLQQQQQHPQPATTLPLKLFLVTALLFACFVFVFVSFCLFFASLASLASFFFYHMLLTAWASFFLRHLVAVFGCCCCCSCARISFLAHPVAHMAPLRELWLYRRRHT